MMREVRREAGTKISSSQSAAATTAHYDRARLRHRPPAVTREGQANRRRRRRRVLALRAADSPGRALGPRTHRPPTRQGVRNLQRARASSLLPQRRGVEASGANRSAAVGARSFPTTREGVAVLQYRSAVNRRPRRFKKVPRRNDGSRRNDEPTTTPCRPNRWLRVGCGSSTPIPASCAFGGGGRAGYGPKNTECRRTRVVTVNPVWCSERAFNPPNTQGA